jgi:hypothetical protein
MDGAAVITNPSDVVASAMLKGAKLNFCVPSITDDERRNGFAAMIVCIVVSTLVQLFDVYLDFRQKRMYLKTDLPEQFHEGYKLSDQVDKKLQKGNYLPREKDSDKVVTIEQKQIEELP